MHLYLQVVSANNSRYQNIPPKPAADVAVVVAVPNAGAAAVPPKLKPSNKKIHCQHLITDTSCT